MESFKHSNLEVPKNYSQIYPDGAPPVPKSRTVNKPSLDGRYKAVRHKETGLNWKELAYKLSLQAEHPQECAERRLRQHYSSHFDKSEQSQNALFKVLVKYVDEPMDYLVHSSSNTLRAIKAKLPKKGDYRLFFKSSLNQCEEIEDDDETVPYKETAAGTRMIECRVFAR